MTVKLELNHEEVLNNKLKTDDKKAVFLVGLLVRKLTHIEYKHLKQTPFLKRIEDVRLDHEKIKELYPEIIREIRKYDSIFKELEEETSIFLLKSENSWKISEYESDFYFTLGYTLGSCKNYKRNVNEKEIVN